MFYSIIFDLEIMLIRDYAMTNFNMVSYLFTPHPPAFPRLPCRPHPGSSVCRCRAQTCTAFWGMFFVVPFESRVLIKWLGETMCLCSDSKLKVSFPQSWDWFFSPWACLEWTLLLEAEAALQSGCTRSPAQTAVLVPCPIRTVPLGPPVSASQQS